MASPASPSAPTPPPAVVDSSSSTTTSAISSPSAKPSVSASATEAAVVAADVHPTVAAVIDPIVTPVVTPAAPTTPTISSPTTHSTSPAVVAAAPAPEPLGPCVLRKYSTCIAPDAEEVLRCERNGCPKPIHRTCSLRVTEPFRDPSEPTHVVCGKRCFNAIVKNGGVVGAAPAAPIKHNVALHAASVPEPSVYHNGQPHSGERRKRSPWNNDGPSDAVSSLSVLLAWLSDPANYARWVNGGDETKFETKASLASQILELIKASGIPTERNRQDVFAKIYLIEKSFAEAAEWVAENEAKIDDASLAVGALKRCKYYVELVNSMGVKHTGKRHNSNGAATRKRTAPVAFDADTGAVIKRPVGRPRKHALPDDDFNRSAADLRAAIEAHAASEALNAASQSAFLNKPASDGDTAQVHYVLLQAVAEKLQANANAAAVAASAALLRARSMLRDEGVPQLEIDTALPLARSA